MSAWKSIVVGVDGSPHSRTALKWTAAEALDHRAGLVVVNVWEHNCRPHQAASACQKGTFRTQASAPPRTWLK
jgi:universal stress protein family protein